MRGFMRGFDNRIYLFYNRIIAHVNAVRTPRARCWSSGSMDIAETTDGHWKAVSLLFNSLVSSVASTVHLVPLKHP